VSMIPKKPRLAYRTTELCDLLGISEKVAVQIAKAIGRQISPRLTLVWHDALQAYLRPTNPPSENP
jgi:hypothetical protein